MRVRVVPVLSRMLKLGTQLLQPTGNTDMQ